MNQVTFGYSLRDRDLLSEGISKFGGLLQEEDEAEEEEEPKNKKLAAAASSKQAAVKPLVPTIEFIICAYHQPLSLITHLPYPLIVPSFISHPLSLSFALIRA